MLTLEYKGDIKYVKEKINIMSLQYPKYYNLLTNYFLTTKILYWWKLFQKDIRSNSIIERNNNTVKDRLEEKAM